MIRCRTGKKRIVFLVVDDDGEILDSLAAQWFEREGLWGVVDGNLNAVVGWCHDRESAEDLAHTGAGLLDASARFDKAVSDGRRVLEAVDADLAAKLPVLAPAGSAWAASVSWIGRHAIEIIDVD